MRVAGDLKEAVRASVLSGELTAVEAEEVETLLAGQIAKVDERGWFRDDDAVVLNETSLIDSDGQIYRPDRVMIRDGKVVIIDYKFGEHDPRYERQLKKYAGIWRRMGHEDVSAYLWYVHTGEIVFVI